MPKSSNACGSCWTRIAEHMATTLNLHAIAQMSAERMLNCLLAGIVIALFAWMLLRLVGRRNSGTRFAVWFCALLGIAASPFLQISANGAAAGLVQRPAAAITMPRSWALYLFAAWAALAAVGLARVVTGLWHLWTIRRRCTVTDPASLHPSLVRTLEEFRSVRAVEICTSDELTVPTAVGLFKPAVVFPSGAMRELSETELSTVMLHELAHLRRWDDWTNLAQKVLRALFFFHPAVWWVESRLSLEREMACDDIVLAQTTDPRAYAECLVSLAEKNMLRRGMELAQAPVGRMRQTTLRVLQILDARRPNAVRVWKPAPWVVGAFSVACLVSSARAPKLVAFEDANSALASRAANVAVHDGIDRDKLLSGAHVVPASFAERVPVPPAPQMRVKRDGGHAVRGAAVRAANLSRKNNLERQRRVEPVAKIVHTSAPVTQTPVLQQTVFVVVEGQPYGDSGVVLWHVSVWRVTMVVPSNPQVAPENSSKSI
jgi:beta-lactamase regulating signal transducer with metallopeptidase domain